jgi:predicted mannosyl-3-phosphoglycerate phosphatase (HAD superfamily)
MKLAQKKRRKKRKRTTITYGASPKDCAVKEAVGKAFKAAGQRTYHHF